MSFSKRFSAKSFASFLFLFGTGDNAVSFGTYDVTKSLTIPGWLVISAILLFASIGVIFLIRKFFGKSKLK